MFVALRRLLALIIVSVSLAGCSGTPLKAVSDFDADYDFSGVQTLTILPINRTSAAEKLISDMQVGRINEALSGELADRGYRVVDDRDTADLYVSWHLVTREKTDIRSYNSASTYTCWRCGPPVSDVTIKQYIEGTFIVDLIDPMRNQSVWRSTIQSELQPNPDPTSATARRTEAAKAIFETFPPDRATP